MTADEMRETLKDIAKKGFKPRDFTRFYKAPTTLYQTKFLIPSMPADKAPAAFSVEKYVQPKQWFVVYRGNVQAPKSGRFRFVGAGDDVLMVRPADPAVVPPRPLAARPRNDGGSAALRPERPGVEIRSRPSAGGHLSPPHTSGLCLSQHLHRAIFSGPMHPSPVNFDRLAPFYRTMEFLSAGDKLQRCRIEFLKEIPVPRRILLAGEGHGRFLPECIKQFPDARILVVDSSERMLQIARSKVNSSRVEFVHADLLEWDGPRDEFDLIVTNFFLDCFPADELEKVVAKLSAMATSKGDWLLADFEIARKGWARLRSRIILALLYRLFRTVTRLKAGSLVPPDAEIVKNGFALHRRETYEWGLLKSEWWRRNS